MEYKEKKNMLDILIGIDMLSSETKQYVSIMDLSNIMLEVKRPTVYSRVDRAVRRGLLKKVKNGTRAVEVGITIEGYRFLEKNNISTESKPTEQVKDYLLTYKQAYKMVCDLYKADSSTVEASQKEVLVKSIDNLIGEE